MKVDPNRLYKAEDVAKMFDISKPNVYALAADGRLPCVRLGKSVRFDGEQLQKLLTPATG